MAGPVHPNSFVLVLEATIDHIYAAAHAACLDNELAAQATRRVLVADPSGRPDALAARGAMLVAGQAPLYAALDADDRDAMVLARALGWKTDRIAHQLDTTPSEINARIRRGLRALMPQREHVGAAAALNPCSC